MSHIGVRPKTCNLIKKETLAWVFSCEFCEISKNNLYYRTPLVTASDNCCKVYKDDVDIKIDQTKKTQKEENFGF